MYEKLIKGFKQPSLFILYILEKKYFAIIPDFFFLKIKFFLKVKKKINIAKPKTFNEKLQWLKLYDRNPDYTKMVDKYEVRDYIKEKIGEEYLIPLLGVWDKFDDIDFSKLPDQFVLKTTHDSGGVWICKDKNNIDLNKLKKEITKHLKRNYYWGCREWPYKNVKPRIIAEKFMVDESGIEMMDYKFLCFNGDVKCSFVCLNRKSKNGLNVDFFDLNWNPLPFERHYKRSNQIIPKPFNYKKMIEISERLSINIPFIRIDFYEINLKLYIGELTFYPGSGYEEFTPEEYDYILGSWLSLPIKENYK
jgi:hypothetical protein